MLSGEMAKMQIADRVRDAEFDRRTRSARRSKAATANREPRRTFRPRFVAALVPGRH